VWIIKTAQVIPDTELWLHQEAAKSKIEQGLTWALETTAEATHLDHFEAELRRQWQEKHQDDLED
jgi:hypothetical protein